MPGSLLATTDVEPWEFYEQVRASGDVVWDERMRAWLVPSYELVREMSRGDNELWQTLHVHDEDDPPFGLDEERWREFIGFGSRKTIHLETGEEHDRTHRWWMKAFSGKTLRHLGDTLVRPIAHRQIDAFAARGRADLNAEFAEQVAPRMMAAAMGFPWEDEDWLARFLDLHAERMAMISSRTTARSDGSADAELVDRGFAAIHGLEEMIMPFVEAQRTAPRDDLIGMLCSEATELFGPDWRDADVVAAVNTAFSGGAGTSAATAANGIFLLLSRPELQAAVRGGAIAGLVEETLRLYGPSVWRGRLATEDTRLGGVEISKGDLVIAMYNAANRDGRRYDAPADVDLDRRPAKDHFGFGLRGARTCPGQGLARTQLSTVFAVLLERLDDLELDPEAEPPRFRDLYVRRWRPLNARFRAA